MIMLTFLKSLWLFLGVAVVVHVVITVINKRCLRNFLPKYILELAADLNIIAIFLILDSKFFHYLPVLHDYFFSYL
jgi:hypothetical protein